VLFFVLVVLSGGVGMQPEHKARLFMAGEIATTDVVAARNIQIEDTKATAIRREQIASKQPTVFDLSATEAVRLRRRFFDIFQLLGGDAPVRSMEGAGPLSDAWNNNSLLAEWAPTAELAEVASDAPPRPAPLTLKTHEPSAMAGTVVPISATVEVSAAMPAEGAAAVPGAGEVRNREQERSLSAQDDEEAAEGSVLRRLHEMSGVSFSPENIRLLASHSLQRYMIEQALPWLEARLLEGVVSDTRTLRSSPMGVLIRNVETGEEILRPDASGIRDLPSLLTLFSQYLRANSDLTLPERRMINQLTAALVMPTLTINREATRNLGIAAGETVQPVYYRVSKGEVLVQRGERVTPEQQLKLQTLFRSGKTFLRAPETVGVLIIALLLGVGLYIAPSGKPSSPLKRRDLYFIAFLLLLFGVAAKGLYVAAPRLAEGAALSALPYAFPVTGAAGLAALIFAARRYCVTGLLLSMFSCMLLGGGLGLFLFYFLSAMGNTWLIMRAQNRQDVVRSMVPLTLGMLPLGFAAAMFEGFPMDHAGALALCLIVNVVLTQFIMFSISPLLELVFGYTTRFRLMELINLEQPLLQDLMVSAPGTYHHSLVVSNMVEAGAKAVGANSLLCKVGALYHDIGKLAYPEYFIENQFGAPNRHDKLAPAMSALILVSHVKKGVELAAKHRLGEDIEDLIRQHHGTSIMRFFYQRALEQAQPGETVREEDFQYGGPRPQSREAAIVMVADMVEASSRTLSDPTPARIRSHIDTIIRNIFADGQLDESALTFQDLHKLSASFARILTGLFHQRIAYPDRVKKDERRPEPPDVSAQPTAATDAA